MSGNTAQFARRVARIATAAALLLPGAPPAAGAETSADARGLLAAHERGTLLAGPTLSRIETGAFSTSKRIEPAMLAEVLAKAGSALAAVAGTPRCTITTYSLRYSTIGGGGEATDASTALILPSGEDPACQGPRPVLLYAHGTSTAKDHNMARLRGEAKLVAALFTAQGYIVVAPNYAGYEGSSLPYHPYLNAEQQAADMTDALRAARAAMAQLKAQPGPQLFLAGYSQGGHVTLATQRAMQLGGEFKVTAAAGLSGPYAMARFSDTVFSGQPNAGITIYLPLIATSAQRAGAAIYGKPEELYEMPYASGIETLFPSTMTRNELVKQGKLPKRAVFALDSQPQGDGAAAYFSDPHLVRSSFREAYLQDLAQHPCDGDACTPANNLRKWMLKNDLRNYVPQSPLLLCGGSKDPSVPFFNATAAADYFTRHGAPPTVVDLEEQGAQDAFSEARRSFVLIRGEAQKRAQEEAAKTGRDAAELLMESYHARLAGAPCLLAARSYFNALMAHDALAAH
ncbi:alpha/beta hydrolase family protein [Pseudoduganella violaceinigra]|uniref:alpha/beta hydrolase family protein n=1 Tax=Pseudoduganella violaceinigra TaxID=246602 RepID=UPI00040A6ADF|nr:prolyl oligopeptidase family serine peptidase [Pseudoduganella violaceinigra]